MRLLGDAPRRRDLLIEFLHLIQDRYGHLSAAHLMALADELQHGPGRGLRGRDLLCPFRRGEGGRGAAAAGHRPGLREPVLQSGRRGEADRRSQRHDRVRTSASCARPASAIATPRRSPRSGITSSTMPMPATVAKAVAEHRHEPVIPPIQGPRRLSRRRRLRDAASACASGALEPRAAGRHRRQGGPARLRRRRLPDRAQVALGAGRARPAPDGRQRRRGRAGHVQGPLFPRDRSASRARRHADRRPPRRGGRRLLLPARRISRVPRRSCCARSDKLEAAGLLGRRARPSAPRRRRLYLRRRVGDDREHRGQARPAAPQAAAALPGRHLRPADADQQCRDAVLDPRPGRARARMVERPGPQRPQGPARLFGVGPRRQSRRQDRARPASRCAS